MPCSHTHAQTLNTMKWLCLFPFAGTAAVVYKHSCTSCTVAVVVVITIRMSSKGVGGRNLLACVSCLVFGKTRPRGRMMMMPILLFYLFFFLRKGLLGVPRLQEDDLPAVAQQSAVMMEPRALKPLTLRVLPCVLYSHTETPLISDTPSTQLLQCERLDKYK